MSTPQPRRGSLLKKQLAKKKTTDTRVVSYIRASTEEQQNSLRAQQNELTDFCKSKKLTNTKSFVDSGTSATKTKFLTRRKVKSLLKYAEENKINKILFYHPDRAFRSQEDFFISQAELAQKGIYMIFMRPDMDTSTFMGQQMLATLIAFSEMEGTRRSERQCSVADLHRKERIPRNSTAPYGWDIIENPNRNSPKDPKKILIPNVPEQAILKIILEHHNEEYPLEWIARHLNTNNIPSKNKGQTFTRNGETYTASGKWYRSTVLSVIEHAELASPEELQSSSQK